METTPKQCCNMGLWRKERKVISFHLSFVLCLWCLALEPCIATYQPREMFLNSHTDCGHGDSRPPWHKVDKYSLYNIRDDVSPTTGTHTFLPCTMVFRSTRKDGRLCVFQRSLHFENSHVEMKLYDGQHSVDGKTEPDKTLNLDEDALGMVEWCTQSRFLNIEMVKRIQEASVRDVDIDMLVYDISSSHRKAYLDTSPSCGSTFEMDGSQVNVSNLDSSTSMEDIHPRCTLDFVYKGGKANRSLCMMFEPYPYPGAPCTFNYTLQVYEFVPEGGDDDNRVLSHEGTCEKPLPSRWCSNGTKISLKLIRPSGLEQEVLFHTLILDHEGGPETLPVLFPKPEDTNRAFNPTTIIVVIVVCSVVLVVALVSVVFWRRQQSSKPKGKLNGDVSENMIEKSVRNGQNHYTDGMGAAV